MLNHYEYTLGIAIQAAIRAGNRIMHYYHSSCLVHYKKDESPVTVADNESQQIILTMLEKTSFPVISEEKTNLPYSIRQGWETCWLVDPLDGTVEFINQNGEFTVNIALIENHLPVVGVIYSPVDHIIYFAHPDIGSFKAVVSDNEIMKDTIQPLPVYHEHLPLTVATSRSHVNQQTENFINALKEINPEIKTLVCGSSIKLCKIAEGKARLYPRFGRTMEWDTAAGHAILKYTHADIKDMESFQSLTYNKENLENPYFIAYRKNLVL